MRPNPIALVLLSGGLDSMLAARVLRGHNLDVRGIMFDSGFFCLEPPGVHLTPEGELHPLLKKLQHLAPDLEIPLTLADVSRDYLDMLLRPAHGHGSALNPCIDCKILFLRRAREYLEAWGGGCLVTGEVLGQRPMSQNPQTLRIIERESGCEDILLRPLSAKLLSPTRLEREGWIERERLYGFSGRNRKPQLELARDLGLTRYGQPAGGCILTDRVFAERFREHLGRRETDAPWTFAETARLRLGRHFRLPGGAKVIVGRNARENAYLERFREDWGLVRSPQVPGPVALFTPAEDEAALAFALGAVARYSDAVSGQRPSLAWERGTARGTAPADPLADSELTARRV